MNKLVIAEKPMLARDIARALCGKSVSETAALPISGNGYTVCACAGHLLELMEPDDIDEKWGKPWNLDALPIEIPNWAKKPSADKKELVEKIAGLLEECDSVIAAGDPDDEGQLIVDELLDYLGYQGLVERVYVNDNIEKNIVKAFNHLVDNDECRGAGNAAYARQMADMCFGVNETRLATKRLGSLFTVGRVQTPTLGLVVNRDEAIANHTSQKYFELYAAGEISGYSNRIAFKFKPTKELLAGEKYLFDKDVLSGIAGQLQGQNRTFETVITEKISAAPLPYNLTVLLSDMSRRYKFSAAKTQQITQDLRDKYKAITYNRSDSQYLKEEHFADAKAVLTQAMANLGVSWSLDYSLHSKAFNDKNVTAHHGIIPQEIAVPVEKMTKDELKVYTAIVERYAMQFLPPTIYKVSTSTFAVEGGACSYGAKQVKEAGFRAIFGNVSEDGEDKKEDGNVWIEEGTHTLTDINCSIEEKETQPPKPYTEGTLIADMASIAKYVKDPKVKEILKQKDDGKKGEHGGIGTTATRSAIIEGLKNRGYLMEKAGKIVSTEKAREFYHLLPDAIKGADVTATWWLIQQDVAEGKADVNAVQRNVIEVFNKHMDSAYVGASIGGKDRPVVGTCPICGKPVVKQGKIYSCSSNKNARQADGSWKQIAGCGFKLFPFCKKEFSEKQAGALLEGKCVPLKGCVSKAGKHFDCKVKLEKDGKLTPLFDHNGTRGKYNKARR